MGGEVFYICIYLFLAFLSASKSEISKQIIRENLSGDFVIRSLPAYLMPWGLTVKRRKRKPTHKTKLILEGMHAELVRWLQLVARVLGSCSGCNSCLIMSPSKALVNPAAEKPA